MSRNAPAIGHNSTGHPMIRSISIRNFRCFQKLEIDHCSQFNIIVGDSGSGKTALLEAIFLAMGASPELATRYRQQRGLPNAFTGSAKYIQEAIWGDIFYGGDISNTIEISLSGTGPEARKVHIFKGNESQILPFKDEEVKPSESVRAINFIWTSANGTEHFAKASVEEKGLLLEGTNEDIPDNYYFSAGHQSSSGDAAARYSNLSLAKNEREFKSIITKEFKWINDLSLEVSGGMPLIFADVSNIDKKIPINSASSGVNKLINICLAILNSPDSVVLIDELENGIYYRRYRDYWRIITNISRQKNVQIIITTHSKELLEAIAAESESIIDDVSLWRIDMGKDGPTVEQFSGDTFRLGIKYGEEIR